MLNSTAEARAGMQSQQRGQCEQTCALKTLIRPWWRWRSPHRSSARLCFLVSSRYTILGSYSWLLSHPFSTICSDASRCTSHGRKVKR
uniref:ORF-H n=1 Tax=Leishmania infantum TaxID=5671 RepID=Q25295_LEIIN|nr:ORF-H [Leishmania infantum]